MAWKNFSLAWQCVYSIYFLFFWCGLKVLSYVGDSFVLKKTFFVDYQLFVLPLQGDESSEEEEGEVDSEVEFPRRPR